MIMKQNNNHILKDEIIDRSSSVKSRSHINLLCMIKRWTRRKNLSTQ